MGIDMEIDLIAGLKAPKIALTKLQQLESPALPKGAPPDFAALLNGTPPDEPASPESVLPPEGPAKIVAALPQVLLPKLTPEPEIAVSVEPEVKAAPENALDAKTIAVPELPLAHLQIKAELAVKSQIRPSAEASTISRIAAPANSEITAKEVGISPELRASSEVSAAPNPRQKHENAADLPALVAPKTQQSPTAQTAVFSTLQTEKSAEPMRVAKQNHTRTEIPTLPAKTAPISGLQIVASPSLAAGVTNIETVVEPSEEIQFGIKIERQALEVAGASRAAPQAAPVASQITAQLPQMLTKAEKQTVELRLDPPELGRVTIHLTTNDQQVTATVIAERVDTVDLMRRHAELLTATLARAGFSQANLSFEQGQNQNGRDESEPFQGIARLSESENATPEPTLNGLDGRLDIRL